MNDTPVISVIMSVYNGSSYLKESIQSVLDQTYKDFEFIIVNDCSTDNSLELIKAFQDDRIRLIENQRNLGLAASLNRAWGAARGRYIARMDDDDIAIPNRFEKQVQHMESNPKIGVLGTYAEYFGDWEGVRKHSTEDVELKIRTLFSCQFCHPTVMLRKELFDKNNLQYNPEFTTAQDYELWSRCMHFMQFSTVPEILLKYRHHNKQLSSKRKEQQLKNTFTIYGNMYDALNLKPTERELNLHRELAKFSFKPALGELREIGGFFEKLIKANDEQDVFDKMSFRSFIAEYYYNICKEADQGAIFKLKSYRRLNFNKYFYPKFGTLKLLLS